MNTAQDYLFRIAKEYGTLATAYADNPDMQAYMREKEHAYLDALEVLTTPLPFIPTLDKLASVREKTRPVYALELRAILRTIPR